MVAKKKSTVTYSPGWNGHAYPEGSDWIIANTVIPSRQLTKSDIESQVKAIKQMAKENGQKVKVVRKGKSVTISVR